MKLLSALAREGRREIVFPSSVVVSSSLFVAKKQGEGALPRLTFDKGGATEKESTW